MSGIFDDSEPEPRRRKPRSLAPAHYRGLSVEERLAMRLAPAPESPPCVVWTGGRNGDGAPCMRDQEGRVRPAQHLLLDLAGRPNPKPTPPFPVRTLVVHVTCKTPWCMHPPHLEWVDPDWKDYRP